MTYSADYTEVRYIDPRANSSKFYRAYVLHDEDTGDARVLFNWGRIGAKGQFQVQLQPDVHAARSSADGKLHDKRRKGYEQHATRTLAVVPDDLLELAGVGDNERSQAAARIAVDPFAAFDAGTDRLMRLVTGPAEVQAEAITVKADLQTQLDALRTRLMQAEGSFELATDVLAMKLGA